ncbi:HNH endonuclease [Glutamicibacter sp. FBE19]|uniref:HNH endonuclease n=1 Tax=Glutamicibacter sp. FBE19 TaxID=2761534 RepID=UPI00189674F8|nr:HNH endonuclease [Glutamicibacter sp. FBE19]MBF6671585.1 HNH endonuclease [Glutamicibacter sp. FBE19]
MTNRIAYKTPTESFNARTVRQGECLLWAGAVKETGYGAMWDGERVVRPHRWIYEQANGPIPEGADIDHVCGNRVCCEISHLRVTTRKQNMENLTHVNANSSTGVRGVHKNTKGGKPWRVRVKHNYVEYNGGYYDSLEEAETAAIELRNKLFTHNDADRKAA